MGVFLQRGPVWTMEGTLVCRGLRKVRFYQENLFIGESERCVKEGSGIGQLSPQGPR
jgi:hypothetical protein